MRLKQIKLAGFKSFVDPTTVPLPGAMTAVVGPNGCGKSNIIDAVRWVLGESSAKNLRGEAMTDVIFNGSSARKPVSQASVELVFDNQQGRLGGAYASFAEIAVRRVVNRDSENTYYLNGSRCRRKDITDLFLGTGLGPRSYAIIEQGMISRLIESRPQELRVFIEEAAGISKYKEKRRETETRLRHTSENMERLNDVREELGQQLEKLKRQASAARRYRELKARERQLKAELTVLRYLELGEQMSRLDASINQLQVALAAAESELQQGETADLALLEDAEQQETVQRDLQQRLVTVASAVSRLEQQMLMQREQQRRRQQELAQLSATLAESDDYLAQGDDELAQLEAQIDTLGTQEAMAREQRETLQEQVESLAAQEQDNSRQWQQLHSRYAALERDVTLAHQQQQHLRDQMAQTRQRLEQLTLRDADGFDDTALTRAIDEGEQLQAQLDEAQSRVAGCQQAELAADQTLRDARQQAARLREVVSATAGRQKLLQEQVARATPHGVDDSPLPLLVEAIQVPAEWAAVFDCLLQPFREARIGRDGASRRVWPDGDSPATAGTLAALIQGADGLKDWLNRFHCCADVDAARQRQLQLAAGEFCITPAGDWLGRGFEVRLGQAQGDALLVLREQLARLVADATLQQAEQDDAEDQLAASEQYLRDAQQQRRDVEQQAQHLRQQAAVLKQTVESLTREQARHAQFMAQQSREQAAEQSRLALLDAQLADLASDGAEQQLELEMLQPELEALEQVRDDAVARRQQVQQSLAGANQAVQQVAAQLAALVAREQTQREAMNRTRAQRAALAERHARLAEETQDGDMPDDDARFELEALLEERLQVEAHLNEARLALETMAEGRKAAQERRRQGSQKREQVRQQLDHLRLEREGVSSRSRMLVEQLDEMQVQLKTVVGELPGDANDAAWSKELDQISTAVSRLGPINLAAIEEYDAQAERKGYLDAQYEDLRQAVETLENAIRRIDRETRTRFKETFDQVNAGLQALFPKVFGGGNAYLELTEDDLLETGVAIMARPPGKKNSTIHLLSGGEKALTALSLVFAIFQLNPAPFCMLDEVDAPLDDANVGRFCNLVREMSETVQFVFISHNKVAMEMATHLTGVTMHEPGVSRMVAVDIEQALTYAQTA